MKKSDKKQDNRLRHQLTRVCEDALETHPGFRWLTHTVNYQRFPQSLSIICVFESEDDIEQLYLHQQEQPLLRAIKTALANENIHLKHPHRHIRFDSESACAREHQGNWQRRLQNYPTLH